MKTDDEWFGEPTKWLQIAVVSVFPVLLHIKNRATYISMNVSLALIVQLGRARSCEMALRGLKICVVLLFLPQQIVVKKRTLYSVK